MEKKNAINCFTPAASWKKKGHWQRSVIFSSPPPTHSVLQNASSAAPFFFFPDLVTQLEKIGKVCERRHRLLDQLLGKRLQKQPCNYQGGFLSLPPKSKASSLSSCHQGQSLWWHQQESDLDKFSDLDSCVVGGYYVVVLTYPFYSSCPLGEKKKKKKEKEADLPVRSLPGQAAVPLGWRSPGGGGYWFNHVHQLQGSRCKVPLTQPRSHSDVPLASEESPRRSQSSRVAHGLNPCSETLHAGKPWVYTSLQGPEEAAT